MRLATADAGAGDAASPPRPSGASAAAGSRASSANALLASRFTKMAKSCAIVLMHEEEDVGGKAHMIEAIKAGVVDVVRFPLNKQSMRTLWQHAVRKMIRDEAAAAAASAGGGAGGAGPAGVAAAGSAKRGLALRGGGSDDSSASEEAAVKRSSPTTVLGEEESEHNRGDSLVAGGAAGARGGAGAAASARKKAGAAVGGGAGANNAKDAAKGAAAGSGAGGGAGGAATKPKPQTRSTQQWRAAEQRGRRLAIKPHTAPLAPGVNQLNGQHGGPGGMAYWHQPGRGAGPGSPMMGQMRAMTVNGQQVQVWVPVGVQGQPGQQQQQQQFTQQGNVGQGPQGQGHTAGGEAGGQRQQMVLIQQANGQHVYVDANQYNQMVLQQQQQHSQQSQQQQWGGSQQQQQQQQQQAQQQYYAAAQQQQQHHAMTQQRAPTHGGSSPTAVGAGGVASMDAHHAVGLRRVDSLQRLMDAPFDADFADVEMLEEDALDVMLAQAKDGNLFDGMDDAMFEAGAMGDGIVNA